MGRAWRQWDVPGETVTDLIGRRQRKRAVDPPIGGTRRAGLHDRCSFDLAGFTPVLSTGHPGCGFAVDHVISSVVEHSASVRGAPPPRH